MAYYGIINIQDVEGQVGVSCGCRETIMRFKPGSCTVHGKEYDAIGSRYCAQDSMDSSPTPWATLSKIVGCWQDVVGWQEKCDNSPTF